MRRAILLATLSIAAITFAGFTASARAAAFTCSGGFAGPTHGFNGAYYLEVLSTSGISCSGGSGAGWYANLEPQYETTDGVWHNAVYDDAGTYKNDAINMPFGALDCNSTDHYSNGTSKNLNVYWDTLTTCSANGWTTNDKGVVGSGYGLDSADPNHYEFEVNGICNGPAASWRMHYLFTDNGNSNNTETDNSAATINC